MILEAKGVKKTYGDQEVLKGVDFGVNEAEIVSIVGKSGAGKTTLLQILGTLLSKDGGEISFNGNSLEKKGSSDLALFRNQNLGFVFQFHQLLPEFTALENVLIPAMLGKRNKKEATTEAQELLNYLGLEGKHYKKPSELSGGERQRVAFARALINKPSIILADEPTGNLDSENSEEVQKLILQLREEKGQTFVIVTHHEGLANIADRKVVMEDGNILRVENIK